MNGILSGSFQKDFVRIGKNMKYSNSGFASNLYFAREAKAELNTGQAGFEPTHAGTKNQSLTTWLLP